MATVAVNAASGTYAGAPTSRDNVVELVTDDVQASAVTLNGAALAEYTSKADFNAASSGWYNTGGNLVIAKSGDLGVATAKTFEYTLSEEPVSVEFSCSNGDTTLGQSVYALGSVPQLGSWSVASAVKLSPTAYPTWTGTVSNLPANTLIEWKCIKRQEANYPETADEWEAGANTTIRTPSSGFGGRSEGGF